MVVGCSWQSIKLLQLYLSYPTKIQIETEFDLIEDNLASFTICKNIRSKHHGKTSNQLFEHYSEVGMDKEIKFHIDEQVMSSNTSENGLLNLTMMISSNYLCYVARVNQLVKVKHPLIFELEEMSSSQSEGAWWIFMHNENDQVSSYEWNSLHLKSNFEYTLSYNVKSFRLLPSPYPTDCFDYDQSSRKDCIRICKVREAVDKCGGVSDNMDVFVGEANVLFVPTWPEFYCIRDLNLQVKCSEECHRYDCFKQHFEPFVLEEIELSSNTTLLNRVKLVIPFEPKTVFRHTPSTEIIEFLCHWGSTLSLWFGFSLIAVFLKLKDLVKINFYENIKINNYFNIGGKSVNMAWTGNARPNI